MSASVVLGMALALLCVAVGAVLGAAVVHLGHLARRAQAPVQPPPEPVVEIDEAMAFHELARLVVLLEQLDPPAAREVVEGMKDAGVLAVYLHAALAAIVASAEMVAQVRSTADALLIAKSWAMPAAEAPERES